MYEVIGYKEVSYNRKSDGKHIEGISLFVIGDPEYPDERMHGREALSFWLGAGKALYKPTIGDIVRPIYNRWGNVEDVQSVVQ